jgi:iron transport multicopper oxidase
MRPLAGIDISATVEYAADNKRAEGTTKTEEELGFFNDILITPLIVKGQAPADASLPMKFEFDTFDNGINRAGFNGKFVVLLSRSSLSFRFASFAHLMPSCCLDYFYRTYQRPSVPTIVTAMTMGSNSSNQVVYGAQTDTHVLNHMDMVEVRLLSIVFFSVA